MIINSTTILKGGKNISHLHTYSSCKKSVPAMYTGDQVGKRRKGMQVRGPLDPCREDRNTVQYRRKQTFYSQYSTTVNRTKAIPFNNLHLDYLFCLAPRICNSVVQYQNGFIEKDVVT